MRKILNIAYYECLHILHEPILFLMVFAAPTLYALLFSGVYWQPFITEVPTAVLDLDNSALSREIIEKYRNSEGFNIIMELEDYNQVRNALNDGHIRAAVIIPENLSTDIKQHKRPEVLTAYDASNLIYAFNIRKNNQQVINNFNQQYTAKNLAAIGILPADIENLKNPIDTNIELYFNPTFNYVNYMMLGLLMMVIHQIGILSTSLTILREKEKNTWIQYLAAPVKNWAIVLGKALPYLISNFFNFVFLLWLASLLLHLRVEGNLGIIIILGLLYDFIIVGFGLFISRWAPNSLQVTRYLMLLSVPLFMLSGYTWPVTHMHGSMHALGQIMPFTWMANAMRTIALKQPGLGEMLPTVIVMSCMAVASMWGALGLKKYRSLRPKSNKLNVNGELIYPSRQHRKFMSN